MSELVLIGLAAAAVVLAALVVGCGAPGSTSGETSAGPAATPQPSVAAPPSAADDLLRDFLAARVAGEGAERYLEEDSRLLEASSAREAALLAHRSGLDALRVVEAVSSVQPKGDSGDKRSD